MPIRFALILVLGLGAALVAMPHATAATTGHLPIAVVLHVRPPASDDPSLASADVALRAPQELGEALRSLHDRPGTHLAFALTPAYLSALERASRGESSLEEYSAASANAAPDARLLAILARHRPLDAAISRSAAGARYLTLATAAADALGGAKVTPFSARDLADFVDADAAVVLAGAGISGAPAEVTRAAVPALERADKSILDELLADARNGTVEILATPDDEPVLPLIIDAGGKTNGDPLFVNVGARADAKRLVSDAVKAVNAIGQRVRHTGVYSPYGAYDDATGPVLTQASAGYALFSDRVLRGMGGEGTEAALAAAGAAALKPYALTVDRGVTLPVVFWNEDASDELQATSGSSGALGQRVLGIANDIGSHGGSAQGLLVLRLDAQGAWSQRPDARIVIDHLIEALATAGGSTTPGTYLRDHPASQSAYGYPPASEAGSFSLWMGSPDQASLWRALGAARQAAGGDAALDRPAVRPLLFAAESGEWYSALQSALPGAIAQSRVEEFRRLIASIYRAVGGEPPAVIAPIKPQPTPAPSPSIALPASLPSPRP